MKNGKKCPKCQSDQILEAEARDEGRGSWGLMTLKTYDNPDALVFRGSREAVVHAFVCVDCGYIEYYAQNPKNLLRPEEPVE